MSEMKERMLRGELYRVDDTLRAEMARAQELFERFNAAPETDRDAILRELLGEVGEGVDVRPPFRCDYGSHISIGARTFVNYDCIMLDVAQHAWPESNRVERDVIALLRGLRLRSADDVVPRPLGDVALGQRDELVENGVLQAFLHAGVPRAYRCRRICRGVIRPLRVVRSE